MVVVVVVGGGGSVAAWPKHPQTHRSTLEASSITYDDDAQVVSFAFPLDIPATSTIMLHMEFEGNHNDLMCGFYRSSYTNMEGEKAHLVTTQFENSDARRAFYFEQPSN